MLLLAIHLIVFARVGGYYIVNSVNYVEHRSSIAGAYYVRGIAMDSRLIFRPLGTNRWSDRTQYAGRVIGFNVCNIRMVRLENLLDRRKANSSVVKIAARQNPAKRVFKKSF